MDTSTSPTSKKAVKKTAKKTAKKAAKPEGTKSPKAKAEGAVPEAVKRGPVLIARTVKQILQFTGGSENTVILVSKKSLVDAKVAGARAAAAKELDLDPDLA